MTKYQKDYAAGRKQMYDRVSREKKARQMLNILADFWGEGNLKKKVVLDVGASTGIIDSILATKFKKVIGIDIDKKAIKFAQKNFKRKNLVFKVDDAMKLSFSDKRFDVVICAHVYEHVPDSQKLFDEIFRVLKPGGICFLAAINRLWPIEPHYDLPFLSWLPKNLADGYVKLLGKAEKYYETPKTYWGLRKLTQKFEIIDYTSRIFKNPKKYGFGAKLKLYLRPLSYILHPISCIISPSMFWLLIKKDK